MATAKQKARQRQTRKATGGRQISASLTADEVALLDGLKSDNPELNQKELIIKALRLLAGANQPTNAELIAMVAERMEGK